MPVNVAENKVSRLDNQFTIMHFYQNTKLHFGYHKMNASQIVMHARKICIFCVLTTING